MMTSACTAFLVVFGDKQAVYSESDGDLNANFTPGTMTRSSFLNYGSRLPGSAIAQ